MNDSNKPGSLYSKTKISEDDKYLRVFKHLESVNLRNRAAFDELLRYTYNNVQDTNSITSPNDNLQ
ncbi:MAG: hypothetical protein K0R84_2607 [Clostridia bacterium]|jgi:hypothetical protein|nr:hypothetical protein [Clostridia bacterium]